jgi:hypothetical protein
LNVNIENRARGLFTTFFTNPTDPQAGWTMVACGIPDPQVLR